MEISMTHSKHMMRNRSQSWKVSHGSCAAAAATAQMLFVVLLVVSSLPGSCFGRNTISNRCLSHCGKVTIPYPFGTSPGCGLPEFRLSCIKNAGRNFSANPALVLTTPTGNYEVAKILPTRLIINTTDVKAMGCNVMVTANFSLPPSPAPYVLTANNVVFASGCNTDVTVTFDEQPVSTETCDCGCVNTQTYPFTNNYDGCTIPVPQGTRILRMVGGGISYQDYKTCGFSSFLYPKTYKRVADGASYIPATAPGNGHWGAEVAWAIPGPGCKEAIKLANYSCAAMASCQDAIPGVSGYTCSCKVGYIGDGYRNGSGCSARLPH